MIKTMFSCIHVYVYVHEGRNLHCDTLARILVFHFMWKVVGLFKKSKTITSKIAGLFKRPKTKEVDTVLYRLTILRSLYSMALLTKNCLKKKMQTICRSQRKRQLKMQFDFPVCFAKQKWYNYRTSWTMLF